MERVALTNRWVSEKWEAVRVDCAPPHAAEPRVIAHDEKRTEILFPGHVIWLRRDEAEGYYLNITSPQPKVFVLWRMDEASPRPDLLTVSYHEGARWMDSGEDVDGVPLTPELLPWIAAFVAAHYKPEPRRKVNYATSRDKGRMGNF